MKSTVILAVAMFLLPTLLMAMEEKAPRPVMDVVFCLDSTGSMGSEIAAAKEKIWSIANSIMEGEPRPIVRFGVVTYRDKGDAYVVKKKNLTDDVDAVHEFLMGISANGGGDGPEDVRSALKASVHDMAWSDSKEAIKLIFLVGDAPPHEDYSELPSVTKTASAAASKGININTIACGGVGERVVTLWKEVAELSDGDYQRLARSGGGMRSRAGLSVTCEAMAIGGAPMCSKASRLECAPSSAVDSSADFEAAVMKSIKKRAAKKGVVLK